MRVYIAATVAELDSCTSGHWEPASGYAVTERLLEISASDDGDELAEQARDIAALESVVESGSQLRVVIVVDYPRADVTPLPDAHPAAVALEGRIHADDVACAFVDDLAAYEDAKQALAGGPDALERLEEHDLLWYDVSELGQVPRPS